MNKHKNPQNSRRNFGAEEKKAIYQQKQASESLHGQNGGLGEDSLHGRAKEAVKYDGVWAEAFHNEQTLARKTLEISGEGNR